MALTNLSQVTSSGIHTLSNYSTHNINSTGIITATEFSGNLSNSSGISTFAEIRVTGNLTVEGTTTTLDSNLTEVDRIEVGANSSNPGIAVTQSGSGAAAFFNGGDVNIATGNLALASATPMVVASNGSGHLRLGAGGSEKVRIKSDGNVGIGENTPGTILHIKKNDATGPTITLENDSNETYINNWGSSGPSGRTNRFEINAVLTSSLALAGQYISLQTGAAGDSNERVRVTSAGNVGINDSNPTAKLSVVGNAYVSADSFTGENSGIFFSGWNDYGAGVYGRNSGNDLVMNAGSSEKVRITSAGSVGIGTDNPVFTSFGSNTGGVEIRGVNTNNALKVQTGANEFFFANSSTANYIWGADAVNLIIGTNNVERLRIASDGNITLGYAGNSLWFQNGFNNRASRIQNGGGSGSADFKFYTNNAGTEAERLRITSTGQIQQTNFSGIGFHMSGSGDPTLQISDTDGTNQHVMLAHNGGDSYIVTRNNTSHGGFRVYSQNGSETLTRLRITSGGFIGAGTANPRRHFHLHNSATATVGFQMTNGGTGESNDSQGFQLKVASDGHAEIAQMENSNIRIFTNAAEKVRITSTGYIGIGTAGNTVPTAPLSIKVGSSGEYLQDFRGTSTKQWGFYYDQGNWLESTFRIDEFNSNGAATSRLTITSGGKIGINTTSPSYKLHVKETTSASNYVYVQNTTTGNAGVRFKNSQGDFLIFVSPDLRIYDYVNNRDRLRISNNGRIGINADPTTYANSDSALGLLIKNGHTSSDHTFVDIQNGASESGRIRFIDGDNGIGGQIYFAHNTARDGVGGNCMGFFTANNVLRMQVTTTGVDVSGSTDGVLNLDTTDQRGSFIRFRENGSTKGWAGCSEGIGTGGDQDDFGIRAAGGFRVRTGSNNSIEINDEGQIKLRPLTSGFTTLGATNTYPGAAVAIQCAGVGAGTGTNIPQYGLYVDGAHSSNDATLMTGVFSVAKQNVEGSAIGVHGLYYQDWSSYAKKIGGLFQAPARAPRIATRSFNPGGGVFANTTSTGFANRLASGGPQPNGTTPSSATYGDATALWGDCFRSDTNTDNNQCDSIAIKATNRVTHGRSRVGLMIGTVDGSDTSHNRRRVQAVEYYTEDTNQRFYNRNHKKEQNHHEPLDMSTTDGSRNTMNNVWTANYYVQKYQGTNQYSWYYYNTHSSSYARCGRLKFYITWTTGHASGVGEAEYSVAYTVPHSGGTIAIRRCTRFHQWSIGGSYYGWNWNPDVSFFQSTSTGNDAGIYLRLAGAQSPFDGYVVQSVKLEALESNYGFSTEPSFRWISHSTPSDAAANPESINPPSTS